MKRIFLFILDRPLLSFIIAAVFFAASVFGDRSLINLLDIKNEIKKTEERIAEVQVSSKALETKIAKIQDDEFIQRQLLERFNIAEEGDLIFIFDDED